MRKELLGGIQITSCIEDLDEYELKEVFDNKETIDEWGVFEMRKGHQGIELNFAFEYDEERNEYVSNSAFYKVNYENDIGETDTSSCVPCLCANDLIDIFARDIESLQSDIIDYGFEAFEKIWGDE